MPRVLIMGWKDNESEMVATIEATIEATASGIRVVGPVSDNMRRFIDNFAVWDLERGRAIGHTDDPERWARLLPEQLRGGYLWAAPADAAHESG